MTELGGPGRDATLRSVWHAPESNAKPTSLVILIRWRRSTPVPVLTIQASSSAFS